MASYSMGKKFNTVYSMSDRSLIIEDAKIFFVNMTKEGKYDRSFCVALSEKLANELKSEGWNVKYSEPREDGDAGEYYIPVAVKYGKFPPAIYTINGKSKTLISETNVDTVQSMRYENVDIIISPYTWDDNGVDRVKAYLKTMYITVESNRLDKKYAYLDEEITGEDAPF